MNSFSANLPPKMNHNPNEIAVHDLMEALEGHGNNYSGGKMTDQSTKLDLSAQPASGGGSAPKPPSCHGNNYSVGKMTDQCTKLDLSAQPASGGGSAPKPQSCPLPSDLVATILQMAATPIHIIMQMGISSRFATREILPKLRQLVIWRTRDLDARNASRFLSPSEITTMDICCLVSLADSSSISSQKYNVEASHAIPTFLSQFPKLQRVYIGGTRRLPVLSMYEPFRCVAPEDHREYHHGLLWALCGAFRSRALSQKLEIDGLVYSGVYCLWNRDRRGITDVEGGNERKSCTFCNGVLDCFPVPMIIRHTVRSRGDSSLCFGERQIYERLMKRSGELVWKALLDDNIEVLRHEAEPTVVSITPSSATRIVNLCSWDLRPDCSKPYWEKILGGFTCISRTLFMVLKYVDSNVAENRYEIFEDNPRAQLQELLTTNAEDRRSSDE